jgi:hypothetical protein
MLTGVFDLTSTMRDPALDQKRLAMNAGASTLHAIHILSQSMTRDIDAVMASEDSTVTSKVCGITQILCHPPSLTSLSRQSMPLML